jgi:hypothetical protein
VTVSSSFQKSKLRDFPVARRRFDGSIGYHWPQLVRRRNYHAMHKATVTENNMTTVSESKLRTCREALSEKPDPGSSFRSSQTVRELLEDDDELRDEPWTTECIKK